MRTINDKVENQGATADGIYPAVEFNSLKNEQANAVTRSGQALNNSSVTQLAESLFLHGVKASAFQASGSVNAVVLTPVSGSSGVTIPGNYNNMGGARAFFRPTGNNTGNVTINVGQTAGSLLGTKQLRLQDGSQVSAGTISDERIVEIQFDATNDYWIVLPWSLAASQITLPLSITNGGTGGTDAATARSNLAVPPNTRNINAGGLVTGGGNLSADRTLTVTEATQAQAEAGTNSTNAMTPRRTAQAIAALAGGGGGSLLRITRLELGGTGQVWTRGSGTTMIAVYCIGGGGGGGVATSSGGNGAGCGGGGGAGAFALSWFDVTNVPTMDVDVGEGGIAASSTNTHNGSQSRVMAGVSQVALAPGGIGGVAAIPFSATPIISQPGAGGDEGGAFGNGGEFGGEAGSWGSITDSGNTDIAIGGKGGNSFFGGAGYPGRVASNAVIQSVASTHGSGGAGGADNNAAGTAASAQDGADGVVVIYEFG